MAIRKVDEVRWHFSKTTGMLSVWLFNDDDRYSQKHLGRVARYDFGRRPDAEDGTPADCKIKLDKGLYREPYRDGWKYSVNSRLHPELCCIIRQYVSYGVRKDENGQSAPFTYLRHNRKAYGIYNLLERYMIVKWFCENAFSPNMQRDIDYHYCSATWGGRPFFPATDKQLRAFRLHFEQHLEYIRDHSY